MGPFFENFADIGWTVVGLVLAMGATVVYLAMLIGARAVRPALGQWRRWAVLFTAALGGGFWLQDFLLRSSFSVALELSPALLSAWIAAPTLAALSTFVLVNRPAGQIAPWAGYVVIACGTVATPLFGLVATAASHVVMVDVNYVFFVLALTGLVAYPGIEFARRLFGQWPGGNSGRVVVAAALTGAGISLPQFIVFAGAAVVPAGESLVLPGRLVEAYWLVAGFASLGLLALGILLAQQRRLLAAPLAVNDAGDVARGAGTTGNRPIAIVAFAMIAGLLFVRGYTSAELERSGDQTEAALALHDLMEQRLVMQEREWLSAARKLINTARVGGDDRGHHFDAHPQLGKLELEAYVAVLRDADRALEEPADADAVLAAVNSVAGFADALHARALAREAALREFLDRITFLATFAVLALFLWLGRRLALDRRQTLEAQQLAVFQKEALDEHAIVSETDAAGRIIYANKKFCDLSQYSEKELIGAKHSIVNSGTHPKEFFSEMWRTISQGKVWHGEVCNRRKDGMFYWVDTTIVPFLGANGRPNKYVSIRTDITALKAAEAALRESNASLETRVLERTADLGRSVEILGRERECLLEQETRLRQALEFAGMGAWEWDLPTGRLYWSNEVASAFGVAPADFNLSYQAFVSRLHPDEVPSFQHAIKACLNEGDPFNLELRLIGENGESRWIHVGGNVLRDDEGFGVRMLGLIRDITPTKSAELALVQKSAEQAQLLSQLNQAQTQLLQAEKMSTIGQLAAGVAHEINNPMSFISSNMAMLKRYVAAIRPVMTTYELTCREPGDPDAIARLAHVKKVNDIEFVLEELPQLIEESLDGIERVRRIVQDLKTFSHIDEAEWQTADIHACLDNTLNIARNEVKYKAEVIKKYATVPKIDCVSSQLGQVFLNLLVNAAQAIETKGEIQIETGFDGAFVWVKIRDTGMGIKPEHLSRMFEPFFTTKPVGKGTGLGLSMCYGIVTKHNGEILVESTYGRGTVFTVRLPLRQPEKAASSTSRAA